MARYKLFFRRSVRKDFDKIPKRDLIKILQQIEALGENPRPPGAKKLSKLERYRLRQGTYRIIYSIQDNELTIWIVKVGHRRDVYR